jgi:hypothetical protein
MSLIERAVDKLSSGPADAASLPERAMALAKEQAAKAAEIKTPETGTPILASGARFAPPPAAAPAVAPAALPTSAPRTTATPSDARVATRHGTARKQSLIHIEALRARGFVTPVGAPGVVLVGALGITALDATDALPVPTLFVAVTVNV